MGIRNKYFSTTRNSITHKSIHILYILTCREFVDSNGTKWCILTLFWYDIFTRKEILKAIKLNGAFRRSLIRYFDPQRKFWKQWNKMHSGSFWDLCSMTFRGNAPDPLVNYLLLFLSASDILNCAISWL